MCVSIAAPNMYTRNGLQYNIEGNCERGRGVGAWGGSSLCMYTQAAKTERYCYWFSLPFIFRTRQLHLDWYQKHLRCSFSFLLLPPKVSLSDMLRRVCPVWFWNPVHLDTLLCVKLWKYRLSYIRVNQKLKQSLTYLPAKHILLFSVSIYILGDDNKLRLTLQSVKCFCVSMWLCVVHMLVDANVCCTCGCVAILFSACVCGALRRISSLV